MADVIYSPGTASRLSTGPGASNSFVNNGKGFIPSSSGFSVNSSNSNVHSARDVDEYFGNFGGFSDLDDYINKYIKYNENLLHSAREWEEKMSNTAIQRQMADLKAAGINPILAGTLGGATYHSVNPSYVDVNPTSLAGQVYSAAMSYKASKYASDVSMRNTDINARNAYDIAVLYTDTSIENAKISSDATIRAAGISAAAMKYSADKNFVAHKYSSDLESDTKKWITDKNIDNTIKLKNFDHIWTQEVLLPWYYKNNHDWNWNSLLGGSGSAAIGAYGHYEAAQAFSPY